MFLHLKKMRGNKHEVTYRKHKMISFTLLCINFMLCRGHFHGCASMYNLIILFSPFLDLWISCFFYLSVEYHSVYCDAENVEMKLKGRGTNAHTGTTRKVWDEARMAQRTFCCVKTESEKLWGVGYTTNR